MESTLTDRQTAIRSARAAQFRSDRWQNIAGQFGAGPALVAISWNAADHTGLLWFLGIHHAMVWLMAILFVVPTQVKHSRREPVGPLVGIVAAQATLGAALLFDSTSARGPVFALSVGIVLYACAAGSLVTLGAHPRVLRTALSALLIPYVVTGFAFGHQAIAVGSLFFYLVVVVVAVGRVSLGQDELVHLRLDATDRAAAAEHSARTDQLTGLMNRHGLAELDGSPVQGEISALFIDLDRFKEINDTHGHAAGDAVLQTLAGRVQHVVRKRDVVARVGGDEFVVLCVDSDPYVVEALVARLRRELSVPVDVPGVGPLAVSASIGQARDDQGVVRVSDLLQASDQSMYQAKASGPQIRSSRGDK